MSTEEFCKVVINVRYGGFGLSKKTLDRYNELTGSYHVDFMSRQIKRDDPVLVRVIEELGDEGDGKCFKICTIPIKFKNNYEINEDDDGLESLNISNAKVVFDQIKQGNFKNMTLDQCQLFLIDLQNSIQNEEYDAECL